ncbi:DNA primase [Ligilactobacillus sp. WILCCON 0076]|uniref:DNA primase n=1 Tax=Ligilactobacillus ubinensis TaxID=2876789 RepID=A0A9X2JKF5_9LACO|nr:DNA primase [Ligilactobacillus ubinensis]MCP0886182.1 DNA primase [Ligilactobacillus ubinensis]
MNLIPEEVIDRVRSSVNILDVVSQSVQLHKSGKNWFGLCPFHAEKTPSFSVNEEKQIFNCFSCHRGGNVFKFLMDLEGLTFPEAVIKTAEIAGITLPTEIESATQVPKNQSKVGKLRDLYSKAAELYHHILINTKLGEQAFDYLQKRGLTLDLINEFEIGFAPEKSLLEAVLKGNDTDENNYQLLRKSGLFVEWQDGSLHERFSDRIVFPIRDANGQIVAFSGRVLSVKPDVPKYLNSPETEIFNKRTILFNFDKAKAEIRLKKHVILFEGFMDVLAAYRAGIKNGVASMGTSLTNEQIYQLQRITSEIYICYDGDEPGQHATKRALELFESLGKFTMGVITLPDKLDPDEFIGKYGAQELVQVLQKQRESPLDFYMRFYEQGKNLTNENAQLTYVSEILNELVSVSDPIERDIYLNRLSQRFGIDKLNLEAQLKTEQHKQAPLVKQTSQAHQVVQQITTRTTKYDKIEWAERLLLYRFLHDQAARLKIKNHLHFTFIHEKYQAIYLLAQGYFEQHTDFESASFLDFLPDDELRSVVVSLEMSEFVADSTEQEVNDCLGVVMQEAPLEQQIKDIKEQFNQATSIGNQELASSLAVNLINLLQQQQFGEQAIK